MTKKIICFALLLAMFFSFAACAPQKKGDFYTLQEAYDQGLLTMDDLKNIAYYQNGESPDENFVPAPKNPETLSTETENAIKESRAYYYRNMEIGAIEYAKASGYRITKYYGTYSNMIAVLIVSDYQTYTDVERIYTIEGVTFYYGNNNPILVFKAI